MICWAEKQQKCRAAQWSGEEDTDWEEDLDNMSFEEDELSDEWNEDPCEFTEETQQQFGFYLGFNQTVRNQAQCSTSQRFN